MISSLKSVSLINPKLCLASMPLSKAPDSLKFHPLLRTPNSTLCAVPSGLFPNGFLTLNRRTPLILAFAAAGDDSKDIEVDDGREELEMGSQESQEAWKQALDTFREQAKKVQGISQEAYEEYSKKAIIILKDTSEQLKVQADKARHDLTVAAKEIGEEGKGYITTAAEKSPEVKEIVETFTSPTDDLSHLSGVRDFYVGIPYGLLLSIVGFLSFMFTGSLAAVRFGMILGGLHTFLSISSLRAYKRGEFSPRALNGQAAIATILFMREIILLGKGCPVTRFTALISGAVAAFYVYRLVVERKPLKDSNLETGKGD
ncbi:protein FATTY ACID EXPORT 3, chloroplastic isoform X2 [Neltuma alba]|uniref:protein FATTY ACID EXPORT 3, chloroplastic isoform X2 n=1 Tax=Neltuma alba TaxID=207710 RepID=UPI0010A5777E|nr:protein FATTY ACID EXPORT 3, chloroplastic isoform X2 [Prosopis alba]